MLVPVTPVPVTAKAYATLNRAGVTFVPDAVSCAAPLLAVADPDGGDPVERVAGVAGELAAEERRAVAQRRRPGRDVPGDVAGRAALRPPARLDA